MIGNEIKLVAISEQKCTDIAYFLEEDTCLIEKLGIKKRRITKKIVYNEAIEWQEANKAIIKLIEYNNEVIGTITLSKIDKENKTASIGYWIGSKYWNKGIGKTAFALCLKNAKEMGIEKVNGRIADSNIASRKIWGKYNHYENEIGNDRKEYSIVIMSIDITIAST